MRPEAESWSRGRDRVHCHAIEMLFVLQRIAAHSTLDAYTVSLFVYIIVYIILVAPCFKKYFKIRSWVPSPQMP